MVFVQELLLPETARGALLGTERTLKHIHTVLLDLEIIPINLAVAPG